MIPNSQYPVPPWMFGAVQNTESGGDPNAVSPAGAGGIMQIMPDTARQPGYGVQPLQGWDGVNPATAPIQEQQRFGNDYLQAMSNQYQGNPQETLMAYNWGPGNVDKLNNGQMQLNQIPAETQSYVPKVLGQGTQYAQNQDVQSDAGPDQNRLNTELLLKARARLRLQGQQQTSQQPSLTENISNDWAKRQQQESAIESDPRLNPVGKTIGTASTGLGAAGDIMGDVIKSGWNALPSDITQPVESSAQYLKNDIAQTPEGMMFGMMMPAAQEGINQFEQNNPNMAQVLNLGGNVAKNLPLISGIDSATSAIKDIAPTVGNAVKNADFGDFLKGNSGDFKPPMPSPDYTPEQYQAEINKTYEAAQASKKPFYDYMNKAAGDQTIDVSDAIAPAQKIIDEIKADPFHPARPVLGRLQDFVDTYDDNPTMPLADAVEMKQDINSYFNPKKFSQGSKSPYFQVGNTLDSQIDQATKVNPMFGQAKDLADKNYVNNVALPFTENKLLEPFWKPQDYYAKKSMDAGIADYLPDETQQRASQMLGNVKTPEQFNAVTRVMSPDFATAFRQAKLAQTTSGGAMYRLEQVGKAMGAPLESPQHLFNALRGQTYSDAQKAIIQAAKQPSPMLNPQYKSILDYMKIISPDGSIGEGGFQ